MQTTEQPPRYMHTFVHTNKVKFPNQISHYMLIALTFVNKKKYLIDTFFCTNPPNCHAESGSKNRSRKPTKNLLCNTK